MLKITLLVASVLTVVRAQVPSLGWCPDYVPMANFDIGKFLGTWYEAERYFQLSEVVSRCVMSNYSKGPDNKLRVSNEVTNRLTGIKRVLEGEIKPAASKAEEGKLHVKYNLPLTPETSYAVLETDYKNYAVMWSCNGIGPVHTQNAWIMTRQRRPPGEILQKAYGVLDKYKISKTFFVKSDQEDCAYLDGKPPSVEEPPAEPAHDPVNEEEEEAPQEQQQQQLRSAIEPDTPAIILETRKAELAQQALADKKAEEEKKEPEVQAVKSEAEKETPEDSKDGEKQPAAPAVPVAPAVVQVAEVILKNAENNNKETETPKPSIAAEKPKDEEKKSTLISTAAAATASSADESKSEEKPAEVLKDDKNEKLEQKQ